MTLPKSFDDRSTPIVVDDDDDDDSPMTMASTVANTTTRTATAAAANTTSHDDAADGDDDQRDEEDDADEGVGTVAYHIRYQRTCTPRTRIKFMTDGILLRVCESPSRWLFPVCG